MPDLRQQLRDPSVRAYVKEIDKYPLLRPEQEIELGRQIAAGKEAEPGSRIAKRAKRARNTFIQANLRLVIRVVLRYGGTRQTLSLLDLIQEGNLGLAKAVEKFDPARGYRFSTYAFWWIRQGIQHAAARDDLLIRIPVSHQDLVNQAARVRGELAMRLGREPRLDEVAERLDVAPEEMETVLARSRFVGSLDDPLPGDSNATTGSLIEDPTSMGPEEAMEAAERAAAREQLQAILHTGLEDRAREILLARHSDPPVPWRDLQRIHGLSKAQLQTIEHVAASQCRRQMRNGIEAAPTQDTGAREQMDLLSALQVC